VFVVLSLRGNDLPKSELVSDGLDVERKGSANTRGE